MTAAWSSSISASHEHGIAVAALECRVNANRWECRNQETAIRKNRAPGPQYGCAGTAMEGARAWTATGGGRRRDRNGGGGAGTAPLWIRHCRPARVPHPTQCIYGFNTASTLYICRQSWSWSEIIWLEPTKSFYQTWLTNYNAIDKTSRLDQNRIRILDN